MTFVVSTIAVVGAVAFTLWLRNGYHLRTVQEGVLYRDGAKSLSQLSRDIETTHAKTVVSLVDPEEQSDPSKPQLSQEQAAVESRGAKLQRIEVKLGGWPTSDEIRRFIDIVNEKQNQPVLVHCAQGVRRTAMFVAAYQMSVLGYDRQRAKDAIISFGHSDHTVNDIRR
jgi:protein tyrosine/serine phosphatase